MNAYLRPAGSLNHKAKVLGGGEPALVVINRESGGTERKGWTGAALDRILPPERRRSTAHTHTAQAGAEAPPGDFPPEIASILADPADAKLDRSARLFELVCACRRAHFSDGQTLSTAEFHKPSVGKYGARLEEEVARVLSKLGTAGEHGEEEPGPVGEYGGDSAAGDGPILDEAS